MRKNDSELTFKELTKNLAYLKIIWNGEVIWEDATNGDDGWQSYESMCKIREQYANKIVYEMNIKIIQSHHCILDIKGEK